MNGIIFGRKIFLATAIAILFCPGILSGAIRIMPLGDSITEGLGSTDNAGYRRPLYLGLSNAGYDVDFVGSMSHGIPDDFDKEHEGHYAWYAEQISNNINDWLTNNPADIILLHTGTNEISDHFPISEIVADINQILDNIEIYETDHNDTITVILAQIIDRVPNSCDTNALNSEIVNLHNTRVAAGDNLMLVNMQSAIDYCSDMYDSVHPNDSGYVKMANIWRPAVMEAIIASSVLTADIDQSGIVDFSDYSLIAEYWDEDEPNSIMTIDIVDDDVIDFKDIGELCNHWLWTEAWYKEPYGKCVKLRE